MRKSFPAVPRLPCLQAAPRTADALQMVDKVVSLAFREVSKVLKAESEFNESKSVQAQSRAMDAIAGS